MSKKEKLLRRFLSNPKDFTWFEAVKLMECFGYEQDNGGKTSGSAVKFVAVGKASVLLHRPHPAKILKSYAVKQMRDILEKEGLI